MELKLICHGMMLFWYRPESAEGAGDHGYTILIPQGLNMAGDDRVHEVRFGVGAGAGAPDAAPSEPLRYPPDPVPVPTRRFRLQFPEMDPGDRPEPKGPKNVGENLSFYANHSRAARLEWPEIAFTLDIPYPTDEQPIRVTKYRANPYNDREAVRAFGITPHRIVGSRVFTFTIPDGSETIELLEETNAMSFQIIAGRIPRDTRLHLYSQAKEKPVREDDPGHLHMFNNMLSFRKANDPTVYPFDLELNEKRRADIDPGDFLPPAGLSFRDLLHLWEFNFIYKRPLTFFTDPAECGQGGGCFNDPPCEDPDCEDPDCNCP